MSFFLTYFPDGASFLNAMWDLFRSRVEGVAKSKKREREQGKREEKDVANNRRRIYSSHGVKKIRRKDKKRTYAPTKAGVGI